MAAKKRVIQIGEIKTPRQLGTLKIPGDTPGWWMIIPYEQPPENSVIIVSPYSSRYKKGQLVLIEFVKDGDGYQDWRIIPFAG